MSIKDSRSFQEAKRKTDCNQKFLPSQRQMGDLDSPRQREGISEERIEECFCSGEEGQENP